MMPRRAAIASVAAAVIALGAPAVYAQGRGGPGGAPPAARAAAPFDLTGYWVSVVTEDWRYRMVTPAKGDYQGVPMTPAAVAAADAWNPEADEAAGNQCRSYGAPAIMRVPGRLRITWQDDQTMRIDTDAGNQTRLLRFGPAPPRGEASWQGDSRAQWELPARGRGANAGPPRGGSLKVLTSNLRPGYLRKNGVPYSATATLTEYIDLVGTRGGQTLLVVTAVVDDPVNLRQPFIVSSQFRKQADASGWEPTPCSSTW